MPSGSSVFWFRKSLRLCDNVALCKVLEATGKEESFIPLFILDPHFLDSNQIGGNRWRFLMESLHDLDCSLRQKNSKLLILRGHPEKVISRCLSQWNVKNFGFEFDSEPYAQNRDARIEDLCSKSPSNCSCFITSGHTLYDLDVLFENSKLKEGEYIKTYASMLKVLERVGNPKEPKSSPDEFPAFPEDNAMFEGFNIMDATETMFADLQIAEKEDPALPSLYPKTPYCANNKKSILPYSSSHSYFIGGESEAQRRLALFCSDESKVRAFRKPDTSPNSLIPSTTTLSPYLKFGCISPRTVWHAIQKVIEKSKKSHSKPPVSLHGQLYWREFFYFASYTVPNFDKMEGNPICKQLDYSYAEDEENKVLLDAWENAKTGFPWIDALMTQLHQHGWMHHLGRHAVACFLTRGDLYLHWELGRNVFDKLLLDSDWALNNANWMWLSASAFFHQYHRVYSPIAFGKKTDKNGDFIRHFIPVLKKFPAKYIYEPWKAPISVQQEAECIIGTDYPAPIVDHSEARTANLNRMKAIYTNPASIGKRKNPPSAPKSSPSHKKAKKNKS